VKITLTSHPVVWAIEKGKQVSLVLSCVLHKLAQLSIDETLPTFIKRTHSRKREKKKKWTKIKFQASKQPKRGGPQGRKGTTKYQNLH
jgi:16S rRNA U1498 N3-methylase RsmE